jgi:hypothetical protein
LQLRALAGAIVLVILALAGAAAQPFRQRRPAGLQLGMVVKRGLALPQFDQREFVGIGNALEDLELQATGVLARQFASRLKARANSPPLPGAALIVTTRRTDIASPPMG